MSGTWYPSLHDELEAEQRALNYHHVDDAWGEELDWEAALDEFDALAALRERLAPIDHEELGRG